MSHSDADYVIIGKVGATYGVQGWLKVYSYTEIVTDILEYTPWYLQEKDGWKTIKLQDGRQHGKGIVVKFSGFNTPENARALTGKVIGTSRAQLPALKKDEYYWRDLEGLTVINHHGDVLGKVIYLMDTGANDVLVVEGDKKHAIPYLLNKVITRIDLDKKVMYVNWEII